ncbi:hypothetical protein N2152v2_008963 [Parachlorella kessleri]
MSTAMFASSLKGSNAKLLAKPTSRLARRAGRLVVARVNAKSQVQGALPAAVVGLSALTAAGAARAAEEAVVDTAVSSVIDIVKATGEAVKAGLVAAGQGLDVAKDAYQQVAPVVKTAVDAATPVVQAGVKVAGDVAAPAFKAVEPSVKASLTDAQKAVAGVVDPSAIKQVTTTAEAAVSSAKPWVDQATYFLTHTDPVSLGEYGLGLLALYYLAPPLLKATFGALRGFAGEVSPAAALDALSSGGGAVLLDIRTAREKEAAGLPDLPGGSGKLVEVEYASIADRKLRGQLRNAGDLELKITAMQVAALKRLGKGTTVYLLDRNGSSSKAVAKELAKRGFSRAYVISGGFQAWTSAKLATKLSSTVSRVEVLAPGSFLGTFSTRKSNNSSVKSLPGSNSNSVSARRALPSSISR